MMQYEIFYAEPLIEKDVRRIISLMKELSPHRIVTPEDVYTTAKHHNLFVARDEKDRIVGVATLVRIDLAGKVIGQIEDVVVASKLRGQGLGKGLMKKMLSFAKGCGLARLHLTSRPERTSANDLYTKLGFKLRNTNVYGLDCKDL